MLKSIKEKISEKLPDISGLADKVPNIRAISDKIPNASSLTQYLPDAGAAKDKLSTAILDTIANNKDIMNDIIKDKAGKLAVYTLQSDDFILLISSRIYQHLPEKVRFLVNEDTFTYFILKHRTLITDKIQRLQSQNATNEMPHDTTLLIDVPKDSKDTSHLEASGLPHSKP